MDAGTAGAGAGGASRARANDHSAGQRTGARLGLLLDGAAASEARVFRGEAFGRDGAEKDGVEEVMKRGGSNICEKFARVFGRFRCKRNL